MSQVVSLRGAVVPKTKQRADPDIVLKLRELLKLARDGQIHGFIYGFVNDSGSSNGWEGKADQKDMIAVSAKLNFRILRAAEE